MSENNALLRRIRLLMAKANAAGTTEAEAAAFAAKVQELLVANGLRISDVGTDDDVERGDVNVHNFARNKWDAPLRKRVLDAVCTLYTCRLLKYQDRYTIVGRPHNVTVAVEMSEYLIKTVTRLAREHVRKNPGAVLNDFKRGCTLRLCQRIFALYREQTAARKEYRIDGNPGNLPALLASEVDLVEQYMKKNLRVKIVNPRHIKDTGVDFVHGAKAADSVSLHTQVGTKGGRLMLEKK
jgi:hypothetical protein